MSEVMRIGPYSFSECINLHKIVLPINLHIENEAFDESYNIKEIIYPGKSSQFVENFKEYFSKLKYYKFSAGWYCNPSIDIIRCNDKEVSVKKIAEDLKLN